MGALAETFVDPSIAADSGTGTIGDPFGDLQFAFNSVTRDATNGDRFNILTGTDEILAAALSLATYGTPTAAAPLLIEGFTAAAGDGGIGGIDGNGSFGMWASSLLDSIWMKNLHCHNSGSATIIDLDNDIAIVNVEVDTTTGSGIDIDASGLVADCNIHNIGGIGIRFLNAIGSRAVGNYLTNGANSFTDAIFTGSQHCKINRNIISISGASNGISLGGIVDTVNNNAVLSSSGTGTGIRVVADTDNLHLIYGNAVEGFIGVGGVGYDTSALTTNHIFMLERNVAFNNTTNYSTTGEHILLDNDNEVSPATPFAKSGLDTFVNRLLFFEAANTGNVQGGGYPSGSGLDKGAVQHRDPAGAGRANLGLMSGGVL